MIQEWISAIIPMKKLHSAKSRLAVLMTTNERRQFCLKMLSDVLRTVKSTEKINQTVVVGNDVDVFTYAKNFEVDYLKETGTSLNEAVMDGITWSIRKGTTTALILPADVPLITPTDLKQLLNLRRKTLMIIAPARNGEGTNALLLTPPNICPPRYGRASLQRHGMEAAKRNIGLRIFKSKHLGLDIDTTTDVKDFLKEKHRRTATYKFLLEIGVPHRL
jgi:2-phospho-L-lactate guanylyltransferase